MRELRNNLWLHSLLVIVAGLLNTLAFAPYQWYWLPLLTLMVLSVLLSQARSPRVAAWLGFCYGIGWFGLGISWVHVSIATFGGMPLVASLAIMALLVLYLSLFPALASYAAVRLAKTHYALFPLMFASCWVLAEYLRSWFLTGFPWLSLGYSQTEGYLAPYAPLIGETGITFLLAIAAASIVPLLHKQWIAASWIWPVLLVSPLLSVWHGWQVSGEKVKVALVQGNIAQSLRWEPEQELPTMTKYLRLTKPHFDKQLIIWPEAAIPQIEPLAQAYLINLDMQAAEHNTAVITGILDYRRNGDAYNGIIVLGKQQASETSGDYHYQTKNRYQKHHLLPIGEFVPFEAWLRDVAPFFDLPNSSFSRGERVQPNLQANGFSLLAALCFEIVFPRQVRANFTADTDFLLTISNDAWFGDSIGPHQHMQIAQMRALEFGRPLLRATNTGVTGIVKADGSMQAVLPQFEDAVLTAEVELSTGETLYSKMGDTALLSFAALFLLFSQVWRKLFSKTRKSVL